MDNEELVRRICAEVFQRLQSAQPPVSETAEPCHKILAIITGGTIGLEQGLEELLTLQRLGGRLTVVLSEAARQVAGLERIRSKLGSGVNVITPGDPYPKEELRNSELVVVPVLTQNSAAKFAATIADTITASLLMQALLMGKPVIAAVNAADPKDPCRQQIKMNYASPALVQVLQGNLKKIETYGVHLVQVGRLAAEAQNYWAVPEKPAVAAGMQKKSVIDAETVKAVAASGEKQLILVPGTIITPLARDVAREYGIEISVGVK